MRSKLVWLTVVMLLVYATLLVLLYQQTVPDQEVPGGTLPGLGTEAVPIAAKYAAITAIPLSLIFLWADRFRPQRFWVWLMTFGWGACVATFVSAQVNTWAAGHLSIIGDGDPATGARAAIFVAPFVEEAVEGHRAVLAGDPDALPVGQPAQRHRARRACPARRSPSPRTSSTTAGSTGTPRGPSARCRRWRPCRASSCCAGVMTFFGHPLFTAMIGIGLAVALRSKSKIVRVVAPLAGFCAAAFLHMAFNTTASLVQGPSLLFIYLGVALPLVIGLIIFVVRQLFREGRLIRERLLDYVRVGWLPESDPAALSRLRTRMRALWHAVFLGPDAFLATIRLQRAVTELAYLRDAMTRGLVDQTGVRTGEGPADQDPRRTRPGGGRSRRAGPATRRCGGVRPPRPRTRRRASPDPPGWAATTRQRRRTRRRPECPGRRAAAGQRSVGADCYPVLRGRPQLETPGGVGAR